MPEWVLGAASAFWFGILTSISPCPLATNITAMSFVGRRVGSPRKVLARRSPLHGGPLAHLHDPWALFLCGASFPPRGCPLCCRGR